jgi:pectate lyase
MDLTDRLASGLLSLPGVEERKSRFGPHTAFFIGSREFAHVHRDGEIDVRLTRRLITERRDSLQDDSRVSMRRGSDWITVSYSSSADVPFAVELGRSAYQANQSARR